MGNEREPSRDLEHDLEHYLQGHMHPDVQPLVRREIRLGTVSIEGFLRLADVFQASHEAYDSQLVDEAQAELPFDDDGVVVQVDFTTREQV